MAVLHLCPKQLAMQGHDVPKCLGAYRQQGGRGGATGLPLGMPMGCSKHHGGTGDATGSLTDKSLTS